MLRAAGLVLLLAGCRLGFDALGRDAAPDDMPDAIPDARPDTALDGGFPICITGGGLLRVCFQAALSGERTIPAGTTDIDTDRSPLCDGGNDQVDRACVIAASRLTIAQGAVVSAHGIRPLVLVATDTIALAGAIDVSSSHDGTIGAGANPPGCVSGGTAPTNAGGGAGGSFQGPGGTGKPSIDGGVAATAAPTLDPPAQLRGGCPGRAGSTHDDPTGGGAGGSGGGAVALIAQTLDVPPSAGDPCRVGGSLAGGCIDASGAGGQGGPAIATGAGGGGGGAGGMIVIDVVHVSQDSARLFANGGGGGQGGAPDSDDGTGAAVAGLDGGESPGPGAPAPGAVVANNNASGDGASGSSTANAGDPLAGQSASDPLCVRNVPGCRGAGGGGGGGAGYIYAPPMPDARFDPARTAPPTP